MSEQQSNIVSLQYRKKQQAELSRKEYLDPNVRIRDLEVEVIRLQDHALEMEETVRAQARSLASILRLLQKAVGPSSSSSEA